LESAIRDYNQAIQINSNYAVAVSNRAFAYKRKGLLDRAAADFRKALSLYPDQSLRNRIEAALASTPSAGQLSTASSEICANGKPRHWSQSIESCRSR
jgi:tetratricopeptide (TPR) repeat protein